MRISAKLFLYFICYFLIYSGSAFTQTKAVIRGKVIDNSSKESLPFVNIKLTNSADNSFFREIQSDAKGLFVINNLTFSSYNIRFTYMGYQIKSLTRITLSIEKSEINLQDVALSGDSQMLEEVVVEYRKPVIEMLQDKLVYNVDQGVFSEGSSASDILKNVPMVSVDIDGKATISGRRNTRIFIDGKPTDFSANRV